MRTEPSCFRVFFRAKGRKALDIFTAVKTSFEDNEKIVGTGGFVGHMEGEYQYDILSSGLQETVNELTFLLNAIPGLGLGDLITILLDNGINVGSLIPIGYVSPRVENCTASACTITNDAGKLGVGGFVGSQCGSIIRHSRVTGNDDLGIRKLSIEAERFGGGFAGVERDDVIKQTLSDLGVIVGKLYPQSEIINCAIENTELSISGGHCLGGFIGAQANSYAINDTIENNCTLSVTADGDCIGGFTGMAQLGSSFGLAEYIPGGDSVLGTVSKLLKSVLSNDNNQALLAMGGVSQSAILGAQINCPLSVTSSGSQLGGLVGSGDGVYIAKTGNYTELNKYSGEKPAASDKPALYECFTLLEQLPDRSNVIASLTTVHTEPERGENGGDFVGGAAGRLVSANAGSLLGSTLGLKSYLGFRLSDLTVYGAEGGYSVKADGDYAGGAIGFAIGGDVKDVALYRLKSVTADNHAGGFVGTTGPDKVAGGNGLDLKLLNIDVLKIDNLLNMTGGIHTIYENATVDGIDTGFTVEALGVRKGADETDFTAGGFAGDSTSVAMTDCKVNHLLRVHADKHHGMAGGFVGHSSAGSLAGVDKKKNDGVEAITVSQLLQIESDLVPAYESCEVSFVNGGYVEANAAGGFAGEFRSGTVNVKNDVQAYNRYAVHNIDHVLGGAYAGGFGGNVYSGALLRDGGSGLGLLSDEISVDITGLANMTKAYIPKIHAAGVDAPDGFSVLAAYIENANAPATNGYAGGFIGYGSGIEVSHCDVNMLRNGKVTTPTQLEDRDGGNYLRYTYGTATIPYAVAGARCAGGYIGYMNVGCATAIGDGIKLLKREVKLDGVLKGLDVIVSTIEHSDVFGKAGGYSVLASSHVNLGDGSFDEKGVGYAGGFAGRMLGAHIQDSNAENFAYVIGEVAAGGYVGEMLPGSVAEVLPDDNDGINQLLDVVIDTDNMTSLIQAFVPTVYNSRTTCIPCGGAVRAQSLSDSGDGGNVKDMRRGFAGGYVGHASGAQIWGDSTAAWRGETAYSGTTRPCDAWRIRSVYGAEYAGGYVGLLEAGSTASTGNLSLLGGLIKADNLVGALNVVYPTIDHTHIYGPLQGINYATFEKWYEFVGQYGGFAYDLSDITSQAELEERIRNYYYGYQVVAGRDTYDSSALTRLGGCAGGYAGAMHSGVIRNSAGIAAKQVRAMRAAGGFAGEMLTKGLAEFGGVNLLGLENINLGKLLQVTDVLVPVVFESGTEGYQNGLIVRAEGVPEVEKTVTFTVGQTQEGQQSQQMTRIIYTDAGNAGGFVGTNCGGQIGSRSDGRVNFKVQEPVDGAWVRKLKTVTGKNCIGGFVGKTTAASVANADVSDTGQGFVQGLLDSVIGDPSELVSALDATVSVIGKAEVTAAKEDWGIVVDGEYTYNDETRFAPYAGGFAGLCEATVFGNRELPERTLKVDHLRGVSGGHYAGGFFGLADVGSVAAVGGKNGESQTTSVLDLIQLGNLSLLDIFRTYIYHATVTGVDDGIMIDAHDHEGYGTMSTYRQTGAAGGFGGGLMNGTVEHSSVSDVNFVQAPNYAAGFIGICGTSGGIGTDKAAVASNTAQTNLLAALGLDLSLNPQLLNVVGSTVTDCGVSGMTDGFIAKTGYSQIPVEGIVVQDDLKGSCAAGFVGFADMAHIENARVTGFKFAKSPQAAGGFVGRSSMNYLVDVDLDSHLTAAVVRIVNVLVKALYLDEASRLNLINAENNSDLLGLRIMSDGDLVYVNLLGLKIGVSLSKDDPEYGGTTNAAIITIGSSTVKLPCDENGLKGSPDLSVTLIEGNRTNIKNGTVKGVPEGYDVFAGGADDTKDGTDALGYAGGFIGLNDAGRITGCATELCDVVRGTANQVGPFVGSTRTGSRTVDFLEGHENDTYSNSFSVYRSDNGGYTSVKKGSEQIADDTAGDVAINGESCNRYRMNHLQYVRTHADLDGAVESDSTTGMENRALAAYASPAMAVLMLNIPLNDNGVGDTPNTSDLKDPCDEEFILTVNKNWKDFLLFASRPDSITVRIAQVEWGAEPPSEMIVAGVPKESDVVKGTYEVTLDSSDGSPWTSVWQKTVEHLPVADRAEGSATATYYQYLIQEVEVRNYKASYRTEQASAAVTVTNRYSGPLLPTTGGSGTVLFYSAGLLLIIGAGVLLILRLNAGKKDGGKKKSVAASADATKAIDIMAFFDFLRDRK